MSRPASSPGRGILLARDLRRICQAVSLTLFLGFLWLLVEKGPLLLGENPLEWVFFFDPATSVLVLLATGTLAGGLILGLAVVAVTILMGRGFCAWICPMGTLQHVVARLRKWKASMAIRRNRPGAHLRVKYLVLAFFLGSAVLGSVWMGLLDPMAFLARGISEGLLPSMARLLVVAGEVVALVPAYPFDRAPDLAWMLLGRAQLSPEDQVSSGALLTLALLVVAVGAAAWMPRFWCRVVCPLGAMLGLLSRFRIFGLEKDEARCTHCGLCTRHCEGACDPEPGRTWKGHECVLCLNCQASCPENALHFRFFPVRDTGDRDALEDAGRRALLASALAGVAAVPAARAGLRSGDAPHPRRIRPPGSLPEDLFLERCIRCGACMKVCPTNVIQPALGEAGIEGLYTPVLVPAAGFCEATCTACGASCPTGAISPITEAEKGWEAEGERIRLGTATIDRGRCLPWANRTPCIVCEEHCPTPTKAIRLAPVETTDLSGSPVLLSRPEVDPDLCVGCGACEHVCPVASRPAIRVIAWRESREVGRTPGKLSM